MNELFDVTIIGAGIIDALAYPVNGNILNNNFSSMKGTKLGFGGDALNETAILENLGKKVNFISKVGNDMAGSMVLNYLRNNNISVDNVVVEDNLETSVNLVLVDEKGERHFLTNPKASLRKLSEKDILDNLDNISNIVSFASMFVSEDIDIESTERIFKKIKSHDDTLLCVDMKDTRHGETIDDLKGVLKYVDFIFPNESEIANLTGTDDIYKNGEILLDFGVKNAVIKLGSRGCLLANKDSFELIPAYKHSKCIDTTGAGDSFASGFIYALLEGFDLKDCAIFANALASCVVEVLGAAHNFDGLLEKSYERYNSMK